MATLIEESITPYLSDEAASNTLYRKTMREFYNGACGTYNSMLLDITSASAKHAPTLGLEFQILAREELCGARIIDRAADTIRDDQDLHLAMKQHAQDEHRHSRMFHALIENVLPGVTAMPVQDTDADEELGADFNDIEGFLISIHLAEIRAQMIVSQFRNEIRKVQPTGYEKTVRLLDAVLADEERHIKYTSEKVAGWISTDEKKLRKLEHYIPIYDGFWWTHIEVLAGSLAKAASQR